MGDVARSIVFASGKGGTGKTTSVVNTGVALAQLGKKVILIDADITMSNLSLLLGLEDVSVTLHDVLAGEATVEDALYEYPKVKNVMVLVGGLSLEKVKKVRNVEKMKDIMRELSDKADFILIDAPAGLEITSVTALVMGNELLLVVNPEISSITDALKTKLVAEKVNTLPLGAILNRVSSEKVELSRNEVEAILEVPVMAVIPEDPEVKRASAHGVPLVIRNPHSPASQAFRMLACKLAGIECKEEISESRTILRRLLSVFKR